MNINPKVLFIIPARGGSKGIIDKNLKEVGGIPLVGRSILTAQKAASELALNDFKVICSTDSASILSVAIHYGADSSSLRPANLALDTTPTMDVVLHLLRECPGPIEAVVLIQPTSPFLLPDDIVSGIELFSRTSESVISVCEPEHPTEWTFFTKDHGRFGESVIAGDAAKRRQDTKKTVRLNGAFYISSPENLFKNKSFFSANTNAFVMPAIRSVDIDSQLDLDFANFLVDKYPHLVGS